MGKFDKTGKAAVRPATPQKKKSGGGTLLGVFIGLVIGVLIAFGVVWYLNKSPLPFQNKYEGALKTEKPVVTKRSSRPSLSKSSNRRDQVQFVPARPAAKP